MNTTIMRIMIRSYFKTTNNKKYKKIETFRKGSLLVVDDVTDKDLQVIAGLTKLTLADIDDVLDENEIPRVEKIDSNLLVFLRVAGNKVGSPTTTVACVINDDHLIIISRQPLEVVSSLLKKENSIATTQKVKFLLYLLLQIGNDYTLRIRMLRKRVSTQKKQLENVSPKMIKELIEVEEVLNQYLAILVPTKNVFSRLLTGKFFKLFEQDSELFEDLIISIDQSVDVCSVSLKSIRSLRDSYQIVFSNELNQTMKLLTSITIILTIPTIISSIYGMNIGLPLANSPFAFSYVLGLSAFLSSLVLVIFWWKRWF